MTSSDYFSVPARFIAGSKFYLVGNGTKSSKASHCPKAVTLRVDPNGHILYWMPRVGETSNYIFIQDIVDVRIGRQAAHAYESMKRNDSSTMSIVSNVDFIHPVLSTFVYSEDDPKTVTAWSEFLFPFALNTRRKHFGVLYHIRKSLAPFLYASETNEFSLEHFEAALKSCTKDSTAGIAMTRYRSNSTEGNAPLSEKITDRDLVKIFLSVGGDGRGLRKVFDELCENGNEHISRKSFLRFLQVFQRDPRLNEARHPKMSERGMDKLLEALGYPEGVNISFHIFVHYLWSDFCTDSLNISQEKVGGSMHEPLASYFINSSHNTYCIGLQVKGAQLFPSSSHKEALADVEMYRQVLLSGCRCIELDCWDGADGPVITHGPSAVMRMNEIPLKVVCSAIDECAFKVSPYPVLLSIENHLCQQQQKMMVQILRDTFGSKLLTDALETHPLVEDQVLPSPHALRYKIIIKAKRSKPPKIQQRSK
ncbi:hypothetical protein GCK32_005633 [Trichostrongylus colubriformis]|uniref:Phosphoinositide phospholipase C n=1 Tax=Trichostrongylus colubriformis TaxID=6319 RepID=A0AAN8F2K8_TRICO